MASFKVDVKVIQSATGTSRILQDFSFEKDNDEGLTVDDFLSRRVSAYKADGAFLGLFTFVGQSLVLGLPSLDKDEYIRLEATYVTINQQFMGTRKHLSIAFYNNSLANKMANDTCMCKNEKYKLMSTLYRDNAITYFITGNATGAQDAITFANKLINL